jgi:hypothetical protein
MSIDPLNRFFVLFPGEVRNLIYSYAGTSETSECGPTIYLHDHPSKGFQRCMALAQTCRQIRREYLPFIFMQNHFSIVAYWGEPLADVRPSPRIMRDCDFALSFLKEMKQQLRYLPSVCLWIYGPVRGGGRELGLFPLQLEIDEARMNYTIRSVIPILSPRSRLTIHRLLREWNESVTEEHAWRPNVLAVLDRAMTERLPLGWYECRASDGCDRGGIESCDKIHEQVYIVSDVLPKGSFFW